MGKCLSDTMLSFWVNVDILSYIKYIQASLALNPNIIDMIENDVVATIA